MKATNTVIIYIYNSRHVFASHALNMSGYFDQSARSLESRSMVIQLQRPAIYRQAARSVRICEPRLLHVWPCHTATENFTISFNFRMTPINKTDYCFSFLQHQQHCYWRFCGSQNPVGIRHKLQELCCWGNLKIITYRSLRPTLWIFHVFDLDDCLLKGFLKLC